MTTAVQQAADVDIKSVLRQYSGDFPLFARQLVKIQTKRGDLVPFRFNEDQQLLEAIEKDILKRGRLLRMIILKARRRGVSTHRIAKNYHRTIFKFNRYAYHVVHDPDSKDFLFGMTKRMHAHNPCRPQELYNSKSILEFNTKDRKGMDSAIRVGAAGKDHLGSGQLIHYLHLSELAKWPQHSAPKLLTSLLQCVPRDVDSEVVVESTAAGLGGEFYEWFWSARYFYEVFLHRGRPAFRVSVRADADPENEYAAVFIPWFANREYQLDPEPGFTRTTTDHPFLGNEQKLVELYGIHDGHLKWRRVTIANECKGKLETFQQEYPSNPEEAFLASGRPVFTPITQVLARKKAIEKAHREKDPRKFYRLEGGQWISSAPDAGDTDGLLQVWSEPRAGVAYVVAADVAEGLEKGDWDSVDVVEQLSGRQVAHFHAHMAPDQLGVLLYHLGKRYNVACVAPERNNHGLTTVTKLFDMDYPNLFVEEVDEPPYKRRKRYGWHTGNSKTAGKAAIIDGLAADFRRNPDNVNCAETLGEFLAFKHQADGGMEAEVNRFDDRVISLAIANQVRKRIGLPTAAAQQADQPGGSPKAAQKSMAGYT